LNFIWLLLSCKMRPFERNGTRPRNRTLDLFFKPWWSVRSYLTTLQSRVQNWLRTQAHKRMLYRWATWLILHDINFAYSNLCIFRYKRLLVTQFIQPWIGSDKHSSKIVSFYNILVK